MKIIISLTSTSIRLSVLKYTLASLLNQSLKADKILLNISKENYLIDQGIKELPEWLKELHLNNYIQISWVKNTGPYRKLLPAYDICHDDDLIITCDDDVIYGQDWLLTLVRTAEDFPNCIVCGRARVPVTVKFMAQRYQSYINWPIAKPGSSGYDFIPTGVSGIVYRKPLLDKSIMESREFMQLAPKQDDLWFKIAHELKGIKVVVANDTYKHIYPIEAPGALTAGNAAMSDLPNWSNIVSAVVARLQYKIKAYLGLSVCDNDRVLKKLSKFKSKF